MKKLKIFLPILLISLFFIPKVNASTLLDNTLTIEYSETFIDTIDNNEERINNLISFMRGINRFGWNTSTYTYLDSGNYVIRIQNLNTDTWKVYITDATQSYNYFMSELTTWQKRLQYYIGYQLSMDVSFTGNNVLSYSNQSVGSAYISYYVPSNCNLTIDDCTSYITDTYYDTTFLSDTSTIQYNHCTATNCTEFSFKVGDNVYNPGDNINSKELFDSLMPDSNPYACSINLDTPAGYPTFPDSSVTNVSNFSYNVTATNLSSQDYCIESSFALYSSTNTLQSGDTFDLDFIKGPNSTGEYNINGSFETNNNYHALIINYNVCAIGSTPANVDAIIKITPISSNAKDFFKSKMSIMYCVPPNNEQTQDLNIGSGYAYTDDTTGLTNSYDTSLMNFLNNNSNPNLSFFSNMNTVLPTGPVDRVLTLPLTMLNSISNAMGDTCNPITFTIPYLNEDITIPCMNTFYDNIGATALFNVIGGIASVLILGEYFIFLYNWVDNTLRFSEHRLRMWGASVK